MPDDRPSCEHVSYEDLERRFDGPIPPRLLSGKTERQLMIDHHRAMIRFSAVRIIDFSDSLARLKSGPQAPGVHAWIARTIGIIADHGTEKARHEADLAALLAAADTAR
jgi:hypothetical protein